MVFIDDLKIEEMDEFTSHHLKCHLLQSSSWALVKYNWKHQYVGIKDKGILIATAMILIKPLPLGFSMIYIPRGPIMDYTDKNIVQFMIQNLVRIGKKHHALFIKCDPFVLKNQYTLDTVNDEISEECQLALKHMTLAGAIHQGFTKHIEDVIQPRYHMNVYACENYESTLPRHTIKLLKVARKRHVQIVRGHQELCEDFSNVVSKTENRKGIALRSSNYFKLLLDTYKEDANITMAYIHLDQLIQECQHEIQIREDELNHLPTNQVKKKRRLEEELGYLIKDLKEFESYQENHTETTIPIAGCLSVCFGSCGEMLYAGMDEQFRKFMPQYAIYVEEIETLFKKGLKWYNLGGIEGTLDDGLTKFKSNFNPTIDEFIGEFDIPVNKMLYRLSKLAYQIRKRKQA